MKERQISIKSLLVFPGHESRKEAVYNPTKNPFGVHSEIPLRQTVKDLHVFCTPQLDILTAIRDNPTAGGCSTLCCDETDIEIFPGDEIKFSIKQPAWIISRFGNTFTFTSLQLVK